ncbi:hypothetical protein GCM10023172_15590 [Hymenobacter ginsengisoli]|uniref:Uncharacterized protein n=1 Tax=Hymenobacter ginsengisoli TaxID=1051626 RepID=A0ABP8Q6Q9_9BACT|nr:MULTISPECIES: hypothetical protein [unclassified Hymenobacter]MBO2030892.1 hypothetical protein [Hymenobacter sp. BT559]
MKKLLILSACLLALASSPVAAQTSGPEVTTVSIYNGLDMQIVITRGEGKSEVIVVSYKESRKNPTVREEACQKVFAKLYQEGYTLKGTYGGGYNSHIENTLLFIKG